MKKPIKKAKKISQDKLPKGWSITSWRDEINGEYSLEFYFPVVSGGEYQLTVPRDLIDSPAQIRAQLRLLGAVIPVGKDNATKYVESLLVHAPQHAYKKVAMPGWNGKDFVMANRVIGGRKGQLKLSDLAKAKSTIFGQKGALKAWQREIANMSDSSSYIAFAMMVGFAAPLLKFAGLSEGAVFNFSQASSRGKSTASKCAASIFGNPKYLSDWNSTAVSLEELAAVHNDMLLVLDDTEKSSKGNITELLDKAAHVLTSGKPKSYSRFYAGADKARKLRWNCLTLSSSPVAIDELYRESGRTRTEGQRIRLIDIPIPENGAGIFDRLSGSEREIELGVTAELERIERWLKTQYGTAIADWIKHLQCSNPSKAVPALITKFVTSTVPTGSGPERRLAAKFGLVYAAGIMAIDAGLVDWKKAFVKRVVVACYDLARAGLDSATKTTHVGLSKLKNVVSDKVRFPFLRATSSISKKDLPELLGFRMMKGDQLLLAVLTKKLTRITGNSGITTHLLADLKRKGILLHGHGGFPTRQFSIPVRSQTKGKNQKTSYRKPRFYVFDLPALRRHFVERSEDTLH